MGSPIGGARVDTLRNISKTKIKQNYHDSFLVTDQGLE